MKLIVAALLVVCLMFIGTKFRKESVNVMDVMFAAAILGLIQIILHF